MCRPAGGNSHTHSTIKVWDMYLRLTYDIPQHFNIFFCGQFFFDIFVVVFIFVVVVVVVVVVDVFFLI